MRHSLPLLGLALTLTTQLAQAQTPAWTNAVQTVNPAPTNATRAIGQSIAVDATGNAYLGGTLGNDGGSGLPATRAFGSTSLTSQGNGSGSGFIAKLSPTQQWLWAVRVSDNGEGPAVQKVSTSPAGDVYATGYIQSSSTLTVGSLSQAVATTALSSLFVTRLNTAGQPQWIAQASLNSLNSSADLDLRGTGWDAANGNFVVVGGYRGASMTFGSTVLPNAPSGALFVARLSAAGQWLSATAAVSTNPIGTSASVDVFSAAIGPQGQVALNIEVDRCTLALGTVATLTSTTSTDNKVAVLQLSPTNQWQWATLPTNTGRYYSNDLKYDRAGNLWLLGDAGSASLALGTATVANGEEFVARLSATGQWGTVGSIGYTAGKSPGYAQSLAVDGQGNAVIAGQLNSGTTYTFGTQSLTTGADSRNYTARFATSGQWQFAQLAPLATSTGGNVADYDLAATDLDAQGNLLATGELTGTATFGTSTLTGTGQGDAYVARLSNAGLATGVRQVAGVAPLAVFPNPAAAGSALTLRLPAASAMAQPVTLRDALGRVAARATVPAGRQEIAVPTAGLAPGLYQLEAGLSRAQVVVE